MAFTQVINGNVSEEYPEASLVANQSFTSEDKSNLSNSSFENSPSLDKEKILRYGARSRDEFWDALSSNYDYLMDDGLIATCREASSDLSLDDESEIPEACFWTFTQFIEQFKQLHDLLHNLQVAKDGKSNKSDSEISEEQQRTAYLCQLFNDQAQRLSKRYPDMRDEVLRHLNRLNNKWKAVEQQINPNKVKSPSKDCVFNEITNRMRNLRKWLRDVESRLIPVSLATSWTLESLEKRYKEQEELQKEIEDKRKYVTSLLKLCEHLKGNVRFGQNSLMIWDAERVRKVALNLEHRFHTIWLKSLECHCILEDVMQNCTSEYGKLEKSFSEEPVKKYPRLSGDCEELRVLENELKANMSFNMDDVSVDENILCCDNMQQTDICSHRDEITLKNDKGVMVGDTGIAELKAECQKGSGKFEIVQDVGYSSETSAHLSNDEKLDSPENQSLKNLEKKTFLSSGNISNKMSVSLAEPSGVSTKKFYLAPDKYPSVSLKAFSFLSDDKPLLNSKYGSCKTVPDSFYKVTSVDDEIFEGSVDVASNTEVPSELLTVTPDIGETVKSKVCEVLNELSCLNIESNSNAQHSIDKNTSDKKDSPIRNPELETHLSSNAIPKRNKKMFKSPNNRSTKAVQPTELWKKARVREWLNTCQSADDCTSDDNLESREKCGKGDWLHKTADSSCDASGEYTTESDSEKSNTSDVNNSVTLSQSFTGSIETVIPVVPEENGIARGDRAGSTEPSPGVQMRKKKRTTRDRPWSVTDVNQSSFVSPLVPHSTSESALDLLYSSQEPKKMGSKKLNSENKRLSLTDVSTLSYPTMKSFKIGSKNMNSICSSEKLVSIKKKESVSDKGSDMCENRESLLKSHVDLMNPLSSTTEIKKVSPFENNSSLETSMVSDEKSESVTNLEDQGSISDQAWDEYQDPPYLSEPYSEQTADEDEVKKLINFGDDYRAILGSYSDASSVSLKAPQPRSHRTRSKSSWHKGSSQESRDSLMTDSNSDSEDFHNILKTSNHALQYVSSSLKENTQKLSLFSSEFAELVATCQTNLRHLHAIHKELVSGCELESLSKEDMLKLQDLIKEWEALQVKLHTLSRNDNEQKSKSTDIEAAAIEVVGSLATLKEKVNALGVSATDAGQSASSLNHLRANIQNLQTGLSNLHEMQESILSVRARIHRLVTDGGGQSITPLMDNATKLYQQWEDVYELNCSQLTKLQSMESNWHECTENEVNSSLEISVPWQPVQVGNNLPTPEVSTEDFYHSTAAEVQVADQHDVLFEMETDSSKATIQCCLVESEDEDLNDPVHLLSPPAIKASLEIKDLSEHKVFDGEASNSKRQSCFWRTLRAAVPIQFALVILYCMSCLMEPQCCENMNNYDFSLFPHFRYMRGPPPV